LVVISKTRKEKIEAIFQESVLKKEGILTKIKVNISKNRIEEDLT